MKFIFLLIALPISVFALFGSNEGLTLYSADGKSQTGSLGAYHKCSSISKDVKASEARNGGSSHCAVWTEPNCKGSMYVVPAHYKIKLPDNKSFGSVIC